MLYVDLFHLVTWKGEKNNCLSCLLDSRKATYENTYLYSMEEVNDLKSEERMNLALLCVADATKLEETT